MYGATVIHSCVVLILIYFCDTDGTNVCVKADLNKQDRCLLINNKRAYKCKICVMKCSHCFNITIGNQSNDPQSCTITSKTCKDNEPHIMYITCPCNISNRYNTHNIEIIDDNNESSKIYQFIMQNTVQPAKVIDLNVTSPQSTSIRIQTSFITTDNDTSVRELLQGVEKLVNITVVKENGDDSYIKKAFRVKGTEMNESFDKLHPNTKYRVILSWGVNGSKYWSEECETYQTTQPDIPAAAPEVLKGGYSKSLDNKTVIYWKPIPPDKMNGPSFGYVINIIQSSVLPQVSHLLNRTSLIDLKNNTSKLDIAKLMNGTFIFKGATVISGLLNRALEKNDLVMIRSNNREGISNEYSLLNITNTAFDTVNILHVTVINTTHYQLKWKLTGDNVDKIWIYWCYGQYWDIQGWVECKNIIFNEVVDRAPSTSSPSSASSSSPSFSRSNRHIIQLKTNITKICSRCVLNFGISTSETNPIVWNTTVSPPQVNDINWITLFVAMVIIIAPFMLVFSILCCCISYHPSIKDYLFPKYTIQLPHEFEELKTLEVPLLYSTVPNITGPYECVEPNSGRGSWEEEGHSPNSDHFHNVGCAHSWSDTIMSTFQHVRSTKSCPSIVTSSARETTQHPLSTSHPNQTSLSCQLTAQSEINVRTRIKINNTSERLDIQADKHTNTEEILAANTSDEDSESDGCSSDSEDLGSDVILINTQSSGHYYD